ncbi:MAG: hypothetical protein M1833_002839 [Piccolia ochrophora]|nr:MAG: hypothetical protein M1833_002839 [Piccolia ochrophora]
MLYLGAGAAGSSAAHFIHKYAPRALGLDITIFERSAHVGGRVRFTNVRGDPLLSTETGASAFHEDDRCLNNAMRGFGLQEPDKPSLPKLRRVGVWNGRSFVFTQSENAPNSSGFTGTVWKYGLAPWRFKRLLDRYISGFHSITSLRPFASLADEVEKSGIKAPSETRADLYLPRNDIHSPFSTEVIQAYTRARFGLNLEDVNGLASFFSMEGSRPKTIAGGNWRLFDRMIRVSEAQLELNTQVTRIRRNADRTFTLEYKLPSSNVPNVPKDDYFSHQIKTNSSSTGSESFDIVIITGPYHHADIDVVPPLQSSPPRIRYAERHVTHFTSPQKIQPEVFGLLSNETLPEDIMTTPRYGQEPPFFSLTLIEEVRHEEQYRERTSEFLYKLVTAGPVNDNLIAKLVDAGRSSSLPTGYASWVNRQAWPYAFPMYSGLNPFMDIELAEGLFTTASGESLVSSMEMSCLMGKKVAKSLFYTE